MTSRALLRASASLATAFGLALALVPSGIPAQQPAGSSIPGIVERAAEAYAKNIKGIVGMQRHFSTSISAGPVRHSEQSDSGLLLNDGAFVALEYYRIVRDGHAFSSRQLEERNTQTNEGWAAGKVFFKEPYDRRYLGDYRYDALVTCAECPAGTVAVKFFSSIHDAQHGDGTMWVEQATARVEKLTYVPNALPPHATSGTVTETTTEALPGMWFVTRIDQTYTGRFLLVYGTGTFTGTIDRFQRFTSVADGLAAMHSATV
jgi:hypothetical protein